MDDHVKKNKAKITQASRTLQSKVGTGNVNEEVIKSAQKRMEEETSDFRPMATEFLKRLSKSIEDARGSENISDMKQDVTRCVMELKANAAMFGYPMVSDLASIILNFLEDLNSIDEHVLLIVEAHNQSIRVIIQAEMKGDGGPAGKAIHDELVAACDRYYRKIANAAK